MSTRNHTLPFRWLAIGSLCLSLAACDTAPTVVDQHFGLAVQFAQTQQTLYPAARPCRSPNWHNLSQSDDVPWVARPDRGPDNMRRNWREYECLRLRDQGTRIDQGSDGVSAQSAVERYQESFKTPPATAPIFNIGLGSASAP